MTPQTFLRTILVCALSVSGVVPVAAETRSVSVVVHNRSHLVSHVIAEAQDIASAVYARAGVQLVWKTPRAADASIIPGPTISILIISGTAATVVRYPHDALGFTPGSKRPNAWLAYILGHRVSAVSRGYHVRAPVVLGAAIAHEIGHMLLSGSHSRDGLMRTVFNQADFRKLSQGNLGFTELQAAEIRAHLSARDPQPPNVAGSLAR